MGYYDHRRHAGNAGDVWKHFLLCEAAGFLISGGRHEICADSANGRPDSVRGEKIAAGRNPIEPLAWSMQRAMRTPATIC